jgi:hypothetical protein
MGIKYHSKGIGKNKQIKKERMKPLPLSLMRKTNDTAKRLGLDTTRDGKNIIFS